MTKNTFITVYYRMTIYDYLKSWVIDKLAKKNTKNIQFGTANFPENDYSKILPFAYAQSDKSQLLSNQTIVDLDIESVFQKIDHCITPIGKQYLNSKLITQKNTELISELNINRYSDPIFRNAIIQSLQKLQNYQFFSLFEKIWIPKEMEFPKITWTKITTLILTLSLILSFIKVEFLGIFFIIYITHYIVYFKQKYLLLYYADQLNDISKLYQVAIELQSKSADNTPLPRIKIFNRVNIFLFFESISKADFTGISFLIYEQIKILFLWEFRLYRRTSKGITANRENLKTYFNFIGFTDMAYSIASLRASKNIHFCTPTRISIPKISFENLQHPLVENCIGNSFIFSRSCLITGSNMSGKTTFMRAIAINIQLSNTLNMAFADTFQYYNFPIYSAITISDDINNSKSFFFAEVDVMKNITSKTQKGNSLILLDEIFKGTNHDEKIAIKYAFYTFLNENGNIVLASTHDLEMAENLSNTYDFIYFNESIINNKLQFDYKLKLGLCKEQNAIRILELANMNYSIINYAKEFYHKKKI
ncbi:MutS-related protein [Rhizosphaericola mali]|uniref:DNA mismatch repair proteins mutS family domain-containing protein n=1 Tax=Rhizosphaericola mali TaxID=2545455 RepID=A0A5P2G0Z1_9BACT|nr:hypothetical protein [Rhizosphaericola mali]QES89474.1 hypothetical protein E0W69_012635 [Rhizosphaericola mali]